MVPYCEFTRFVTAILPTVKGLKPHRIPKGKTRANVLLRGQARCLVFGFLLTKEKAEPRENFSAFSVPLEEGITKHPIDAWGNLLIYAFIIVNLSTFAYGSLTLSRVAMTERTAHSIKWYRKCRKIFSGLRYF